MSLSRSLVALAGAYDGLLRLATDVWVLTSFANGALIVADSQLGTC